MIKKFSFVLSLCLMILMLAACGSSPAKNGQAANGTSASGEKVKISIWHNFSGQDLRAQTMRGIIEQFKKDHPDIEVDEQAIPNDGYRPRLKTVAAAGEMPDLFIMWPGSMTEEFLSGDVIQPINELLDSKPDWKNGFLPNSFSGFTFDGNTYAAPTALSPTSFLYYNKGILDQYGIAVPKTWNQLIAAIQTLKQNKITPIALGNKAAWPAQSSILSSLADRITGTDWFLNAAAQKGAKFTDPQFVDALNHLKQLSDLGAFQDGSNSIDTTQAEQLFAKGQAAMMIDGGWALSQISSNATKEVMDQLEVTVLPSIQGGKGDPNAMAGVVGTGFGLSKSVTGEKKKAAYDLIYALTGPEAQKKVIDSSQLVSYKVEPDPSKVSPIFIKAQKLIGSIAFTPVYDTVLTSAGTDAVNNGLQELLIGGKADDIAIKIQEAQEKALKD